LIDYALSLANPVSSVPILLQLQLVDVLSLHYPGLMISFLLILIHCLFMPPLSLPCEFFSALAQHYLEDYLEEIFFFTLMPQT
jgi:hypothetical protein